MKYKVGDEVLVKARIIEVKEGEKNPYKVKRCSNPVLGNLAANICVGEADIVPQPDMTAEEAWEIAKKILLIPSLGGMEDIDLQGIFDTCNIVKIMKNNSPQEAKDKIEAYEVKKKVKIGDLVEFEENMFCVTGILGDYCCGVDKKGLSYSVDKKDVRKTGRHIDIEGLLKQIGGDE